MWFIDFERKHLLIISPHTTFHSCWTRRRCHRYRLEQIYRLHHSITRCCRPLYRFVCYPHTVAEAEPRPDNWSLIGFCSMRSLFVLWQICVHANCTHFRVRILKSGSGRRVCGDDVGRASSWGGSRCAACIHMLHLRLYAKSRSHAKEGVFLIASTCPNYQWDLS